MPKWFPKIILFESKNTNLVALAMGSDGTSNLTIAQTPSYSKGDVFVIYGPPYPYMAIMSSMNEMMSSNSQTDVNTSSSPMMMSFLPPADQKSAHAYSYNLPLDQLRNIWYLCTYPGLAQDGMYGRIVGTKHPR